MSHRTPRPLAVAVVGLGLLVAACSDEKTTTTTTISSTTGSTTTATTTAASAGTATPGTGGSSALTKPSVQTPSTIPTKLVITDLRTGTGPAAKAGSTVVLHYVGVRSSDGKEFDNSYEKGQPFVVTLGKGAVIEGWDQGLIGVQAGGRRRLDIPSSLAYKDQARGDVIRANEALTFVVDVLGVNDNPAPADTVTPEPNAADVSTKDLIVGTGATWASGQSGTIQYAFYRADTGASLVSSWTSDGATQIQLGQMKVEAMNTGLVGMKVGGRRQLHVPFAKGFGAAGDPDNGLPANPDVILIVDLLAI